MTSLIDGERSLEDHRKAFTELSFLLDIFTSTVDVIMGGATASVCRFAGKHRARKIPLYMPSPTLDEALDALAERMKGGFEITHAPGAGGLEVRFGRCAIRAVCEERQHAPGCALCSMFHSYFDGLANELVGRPIKSSITNTGESCSVCMMMQ